MTDLKPAEIEAVKVVFDSWSPDGKFIDGTLLGKFCFSNHVHPTQEELKKLGIPKKEGEKKYTIEELLPIVSQLKKEVKNQGCYDDFLECLKLYDKEENGTMPLGDLAHSLLSMGEPLTDAEVDELLGDCADEEDDEGFIPYVPFLKRMCGLEPPIEKGKK